MTVISPRPADSPLPRLYPIIDIDLCRMRGRDPRAVADAYASGGAGLLQLRQKTGGSGPFLQACRSVIAELRGRPVRVIVNDRADVAVMAGAHGVHIGQDDLPPATVRAIVGSERLVGLSTHTTRQIDDAVAENVDYIAVGPVFRTSTKDTGYEPRGLDLVRYAASRGVPVVAIGGITLETAAEVLAAGAASVAVISDLLSTADPARRVRDFLALPPR